MSQRAAPREVGQTLNPLDTALLCVDRSIREMQYPGFETQMLVWLGGRLDAAQLQTGLIRLAARYPVICSRLMESQGDHSRPWWRFIPNEIPELVEITLPTSDQDEVLACAERLLSTPRDLATSPPLRFYLLRRPDAGDVILLQYSHPLMDNSAAGMLLQEWEQLSSTSANDLPLPRYEGPNLVPKRLHRAPRGERRAAIQSAIRAQRDSTRGGVAIVGQGAKHGAGIATMRLAFRTIDAEHASAIQAAASRVGSLPGLSMTLLASTFRAMRSLGSQRNDGARNYVAGIGLDMAVGRRKQPQLQNLLSIVPLVARAGELDDLPDLIRNLNAQFRDRIVSKVDLGYMALTAIFQRRPKHLRLIVDHTLRRGYSLWYAYFGSLDFIGRALWDTEVEKICLVGPTWSPMGFSLLANQFGGRIYFQATYDPALVSEQLASDLLDTVLRDLRDFAKS